MSSGYSKKSSSDASTHAGLGIFRLSSLSSLSIFTSPCLVIFEDHADAVCCQRAANAVEKAALGSMNLANCLAPELPDDLRALIDARRADSVSGADEPAAQVYRHLPTLAHDTSSMSVCPSPYSANLQSS